jgi:hypothetical protein
LGAVLCAPFVITRSVTCHHEERSDVVISGLRQCRDCHVILFLAMTGRLVPVHSNMRARVIGGVVGCRSKNKSFTEF